MSALLRPLVRLFPQAFRERFGPGIVEDLDRDYERAREQGQLATIWFVVANGSDLLRAAAAEHLSPTWAHEPSPGLEEPRMRWAGKEWLTDIRRAVRGLRRSPGFTVVSVGTLGLAIGANAAMFGVIDAVLLKPLPYGNVDRLVHIAASAPGSDMPDEFGVSAEFFVHYKEHSALLEAVSTYNAFTNTLRVGDRVERVEMSWPTSSLFATLGARPILGRLPVAEDEEAVVVLSHRLWTSWFGADSSVLGRTVLVGQGSKTIVGVMGPEFKFPNGDTMLWVSNTISPVGITPGQFGMPLVARVKPGATLEAVSRELTALSKQLPERFAASAGYARIIGQHRAVVRPLEQQMFENVSGALWVLVGAAAVVLVIACANVANLFMVRAEGRQRDLAVRRAIGASRTQLIRSQMAESLVVAAFAGVLAALLAWAGLPVLLRAAPQDIPRLEEVRISATTLLFTAGIALLATLACGLVPAVRASAPDLARLRDGGRGVTRRRGWARDGLVVAQTALALVLLIGSGLLVRSFRALRQVDPGYRTENIFTFQIAPEGAHLTDGPSFARFNLEFMDRLRMLPGVESVGLVENVPLNEGTATARFRTEEMAGDADAGIPLRVTFEAGDYFRTMGIEVLEGRPLETSDHLDNRRNVVISRSAAELLWPGQDPIGKRLQREALTSWETVVGVVEDVKQNSFREPAQPLVYFPMVGPTPTSWMISSPAYVVKTPRAETIAPEIRALVREVAPSAPLYRTYTMAGLAKKSMSQLSFTLLALGIVSSLALVLGAVGLYGVLSYVVAQRTREIGVRMALGAEASRVRRMVVAQGTRVVAIGVAIGVAVALAFTRALDSLLYGVKAADALTFVGMSACMVGIGLLASYLPAWRASRIAPIESLRGD